MRHLFYITGSIIPSVALARLQKAAKRYVVCPFYHAVSDKPLPHISPLYRHRTEQEFRADLDWLMEHYEPIRWSDIDRYEKEERPAFCLTFDDGLKEFYTIVAPILEEKKIPCVCFLNSTFIDNRDLMFRYKDALTRQHIDWRRFLEEEQPYMTYAQIRELQQRGFEFGSHSINHPHFYTLPLNEQLNEAVGCEKELEKHIHLPHRLFSFPFGQEHLDSVSIKVHQGTHELVFGTENMRPGGANLVNRIAMDGTAFSARAVITGEYLREIAHQQLHD
ncbi:MAG: polysaccharide deacetylase family protein [Paludibacteraceae bacterium]|nr:polysaccharide deacetylase family protein [Paludibacteraceae bacterium]